MRSLLVITGASRGLGRALALQARDAGHDVIAIARSPCPGGSWLELDLADTGSLDAALQAVLHERAAPAFDRCVLVNNAAMLDPVGHDHDADAAQRHIAVNLLAPIVLSRCFLRVLADAPIEKSIINISSGAAVRAFDGWSLYCAGKAGLEHFARCVALEQQRVPCPADIVNVSPGVIDTDMQARIRASDRAAFPDVERFRQLQQDGALADPSTVAAKLLRGIESGRRFDGATVAIDAFGG